MPTFQACLLDYGNTIVKFDAEQIEFILEGLVREISERIGPLAQLAGSLPDRGQVTGSTPVESLSADCTKVAGPGCNPGP